MFTAIYTVARYIPTFPMYDLPGTQFRIGDFVAPAIGILLGPWLAIPCIILGTFINYIFRPPTFLGLDFLPAMMSAIVAGLIVRKKTQYAILIYAVVLTIFILLPLSTFWIKLPNGTTIPYVWLHLIGLGLLISPIGWKASNWIDGLGQKLLAVVAVTTITLGATLVQHLTGGILTELIIFPGFLHITTPAKASIYWTGIFYLYPVERLILTAVTTAFLVALLRTLKPVGLFQTLLVRQGQS
jgi:hypothetical protein